MPKCQQYEFILVMVCLFSGWIETFPCRKADSLSVAKCLLNHIMPAKGIPATLSSDRGTHFTGQLVQHLDRILHIKHLLHCPYHPQSAGAVERQNGVLKPMRAMTPVPDLNLTHSVLLQYCKGLMQAVSHFHSQVQATWPTEPTSDACHNLEPGDWVYVRRHHRKYAVEPRWKGPHQVLLTTQTTVRLSGIAAWIYASQCKKAPSPENQSSPQDNAESILTPEEDAEEQSAIPYNLHSRKGCQKQTLFLGCWYLTVWGDHDDNSFIQQQVWIAQTLNISNCWVCSHIPAHSQTGVPVLAIPLKSPNLTGGPCPFNKMWISNDTWEAVGINATKWISVVEGKGHWCWVCNGTGLDLGKSRCLQHIVANGVWDYSNKTKKWQAGYGDMNFFLNLGSNREINLMFPLQ
ncbi:unnamed protein product [Eretmochelys imbricata]